MKKRALVIGSQTFGLRGTNYDARLIANFISTLGFKTNLCVDEKANREDIIGGYKKLISDTYYGDAAFIYYSGHGGLAVNPNYQSSLKSGKLVPRYFQFIVPFDMHNTTADYFMGITSLELSELLFQLTKKTKNVTIMFDCCHAARMSRDLDLLPKALPKPWFLGIESHLDKMSTDGFNFNNLDIESNPEAVRLVAVGVNDSAYEYTNTVGKRIGLFTESFLLAMKEVQGLKVSWQNIGSRIRERVLSIIPNQRPEIEGPSDRILFELDTFKQSDVLNVIVKDNIPMLQGGRLMGVNIGDKYTLMPMGFEKPTEKEKIADATVYEISGATSLIDIKYNSGKYALPKGAIAIKISSALPKQVVMVLGPPNKKKKMQDAILQSNRLTVASSDQRDDMLAQVIINNGKIDLRDRSNSYSLIESKRFNDASVMETVQNLNIFARAQSLINLSSGRGSNALNSHFELEFGCVINEKAQPLSDMGDILSVGDRVYLKVSNKSPNNIYFTVFDIGLSGKISLLTRSEPSGIELLPEQDYVLGYRERIGLKGLELGWPTGVPEDGMRVETIIVIVSDIPQDLRPLVGEGMRGMREELSPLQLLLEQIGHGGSRDIIDEENIPDVRYSVKHINFYVSPIPIPAREKGTFLIDERLPQSFQYLVPRGIGEPPSQVAIRLKELIVHSNRALFSTEIRIDSMVITGPNKENLGSLYKAETARFPNIRDGDRVPLDNMLIFLGPVEHFIDMAVWVSRNQEDSLTLAEMIKKEMNSADFRMAAAAIAALAVSAPPVTLTIGAIGGAATLIQIGTKLLLWTLGKSIGLYRTSYLAFEKFGIGQHPAKGVMIAQDFSFSYEVLAMD